MGVWIEYDMEECEAQSDLPELVCVSVSLCVFVFVYGGGSNLRRLRQT